MNKNQYNFFYLVMTANFMRNLSNPFQNISSFHTWNWDFWRLEWNKRKANRGPFPNDRNRKLRSTLPRQEEGQPICDAIP